MILPFVGRIFLFVRSTAILLDADRQEKRDCDPTGSSVAFAMVVARLGDRGRMIWRRSIYESEGNSGMVFDGMLQEMLVLFLGVYFGRRKTCPRAQEVHEGRCLPAGTKGAQGKTLARRHRGCPWAGGCLTAAREDGATTRITTGAGGADTVYALFQGSSKKVSGGENAHTIKVCKFQTMARVPCTEAVVNYGDAGSAVLGLDAAGSQLVFLGMLLARAGNVVLFVPQAELFAQMEKKTGVSWQIAT
ncbi:hypothetical protein BZA05DRAFT_422682 [Tricharina praecox]|uniref:uncharacterized protein n=1 Tax=Tricharina praecox TaxID=43433 RepID=UPI002220B270|nr:uncharacterized protein BZA05DRAFT_422682 [Tricharina praecox]KAI5841990.1 hypothetical protein BZA05DRAFT_422682 [Tricharina praecox]